MRRFLAIALLIAAGAQLGFRAVQRMRNDVPLWDFASVHSAARAWLHGGDPYDLPTVVATWKQAHLFVGRDVSYFAAVYPPTSLVMLAPLALLPAAAAMAIWVAITAALLGLQFAALVDLAGFPRGDPRRLLLAGAALAAAPLQFGLLSGQLSLPAISLCILALWLDRRARSALAGVLLGLACALKPQIAVPFLIYYLALRHFKTVAGALTVGSAIGLIALISMHASHIDWLAGWTRNIAATTRPGAVNDYGWANSFRDEIIDLKMLGFGISNHSVLLRGGVLVVFLALSAWYVFVVPRDPLLAVAGYSALILLPIYHRVYDVALLTTALAWALAQLNGPRRRYALMLLLLMLVFLVPFDIVKSVGSRAPHLAALSRTGVWQTLIAPLYAWGMLALTIGLLWTMGRVKDFNSAADGSQSGFAA